MGALSLRNKLAFPAGAKPGFDPSHVALSTTPRWSWVADGTACGKTIYPTTATKQSASSSASIHSVAGQLAKGGNFTFTNCAGGTGSNDFPLTLAAIGAFNATGARSFTDTMGNSLSHGSAIDMTGIGNIKFAMIGVTAIDSGVPVGNGSGDTFAFFVAMSYDGAILNTVYRVLGGGSTLSGKPRTLWGSVAASNPVLTPSGGVCGGMNFNSGQQGMSGGAVLNNACSLQQLLMWANDPWSFWYPDA